MNSESGITYHSMLSICGKKNCRTCQEKGGHGPYWYSYQTINGRTKRTYLGKNSPPALSASPSLPLVGRTHANAFVGREAEYERLHALLQQLRGRRQRDEKKSPTTGSVCQSIIVFGEAGIGKTRLVEEIGRTAQLAGWHVAWGRAYAQESSVPYHVWTELLNRILAGSPTLTASIVARLSTQPLLMHHLHPLLPALHRVESDAPPSSESPEEQGQRRREAFREVLVAVSEQTPLLLVLDDIQWADSSSYEVFAYLARRIAGLPILLLGTCRDTELLPAHPLRPVLADLHREGVLERLPLQPLTDEQIYRIVASISPTLSQSPLARQDIQERAAGNPYFAEELAHSFDTRKPVDQKRLPESISEVLDVRLQVLSQACQQVLRKASVIGETFEFSMLSQLEVLSGTNTEGSLIDVLEEALQAGVLTEESDGNRILYSYWHPLLTEHLYVRLSAARRHLLHRRVAEIMRQEMRGQEEDQAAQITYHLLHAGADAQQINYYARLAADRAYRLSSYREAEKYYRIALAQTGNEKSDQRTDLLEYLGECTRIRGNYEEARLFYQQAFAGHQQHSSATVTGEEAQRQAMLLVEIGLTYYDTGELEQALGHYQRGEQLLRLADLTKGAAWARLSYEQGYVYWRQGNYQAAQQAAQQALSLFEQVLHQQAASSHQPLTRLRRTLEGDPVDLGRTAALLGIIASSTREWHQAVAFLTQAQAIYTQHDCQRELAIVCCNLGDLFLRQGEYTRAREALLHSLTLAERIGERPLLGYVMGNLGLLYLRQEKPAEAEDALTRAIAMATQGQDVIAECLWTLYRTLSLLAQSKLSEAQTAMISACKLSRHIRPFPSPALLFMTFGSLRLAQARATTEPTCSRFLKHAHHHLDKLLSTENAEAEERVEGLLTLAQVELLQGEYETARHHITQAHEQAQAQEGAQWLQQRVEHVFHMME